jgi:hypothetical protein
MEPYAYVPWKDLATEMQYAMIAKYLPNLRDVHLPGYARNSRRTVIDVMRAM